MENKEKIIFQESVKNSLNLYFNDKEEELVNDNIKIKKKPKDEDKNQGLNGNYDNKIIKKKENQQTINEGIHPDLEMRENEIFSHYKKRKFVYENILNTLKDHEKALCYSNIWYNMHYLGTKYSKNLEENVRKIFSFLIYNIY